jgi:outer membrane protein OmpA-like peptidoglycan-associated protein
MRNGMMFWAVSIVTGLACAHEPPKRARASVNPPSASLAASTQQSSSPSPASCSSDVDCSENQLCIRSACVDITPELAECGVSRVHFDLDQAEIHPNDAPKLRRMGRCLMVLHQLHVSIEGNADDKRATAVEDYLERLGVPGDQLRRVTYGKDRPLCSQHNEECWAINRRATLKPKPPR